MTAIRKPRKVLIAIRSPLELEWGVVKENTTYDVLPGVIVLGALEVILHKPYVPYEPGAISTAHKYNGRVITSS